MPAADLSRRGPLPVRGLVPRPSLPLAGGLPRRPPGPAARLVQLRVPERGQLLQGEGQEPGQHLRRHRVAAGGVLPRLRGRMILPLDWPLL